MEGITRLYALYLLQGKFKKAKEQAQLGIDLGDMFGEMEWSSRFHFDMAYLNLALKDLDGALKECDDAWNTANEGGILHRQREALFLKGRIYAEMKRWDDAQNTASELKKLIDQGMNKKAEKLYHHLAGIMELEQKNNSRAVGLFRQSINLLPSQVDSESKQALFIQPLALAYFQSGDLDKAQEEYERIISLTTGRLLVGDIYAKSFYMRGQIYEQKGMTTQAEENYQKFLELWENADSPRVEVSDAQKRLASLNSQ
jgi:tetratricopeptide (TPR) repeat protein